MKTISDIQGIINELHNQNFKEFQSKLTRWLHKQPELSKAAKEGVLLAAFKQGQSFWSNLFESYYKKIDVKKASEAISKEIKNL